MALKFARVLALLSALAVACSGPTVVPPTASPTARSTPTPAATQHDGPTVLPEGEIDRASLAHDSRDTLYRTPPGAVPAGTPVLLRFRTLHDDVTGVTARVFSVTAGESQELPMERVADDVGCYDEALDQHQSCDFWQVTLPNAQPDNLWYRFVVEDTDANVYYADDTAALDGGLGAPNDVVLDQSWALTVYEPSFMAPTWTTDGVVYQIFPDRFRNGDAANDPQTGDLRYDDPVIVQPWEARPEGYCRGYKDVAGCDSKQARSRDYFGGDLAGITAELDYLARLGVNTIYLNPIFDSASNHGYDTQDYTQIEPYFGSQADWDKLVAEASDRGIRVILDGVFNHLSSDSPFFDRYGRYDTLGGCEAEESEFRDWFYFRPRLGGGCTGPDGANTLGYSGWAGVDSIPVIHKDLAEVLDYFVTGEDSIVRHWLAAGASGWRLDVSSDPTFPDEWWSTLREVVKAANPEALTVAEQWQKDTTLLRQLRGDRFDSTMNYRFRDAVLGFLAPGLFDGKGFPASGAQTDPADFAARMLSQQEDYPPEVYRSLLNLIDSHDTERALWTLTPGDETAAEREQNPSNVAEGKARLSLAALIQFTMPGMPTIYYGDEVGVTGDDDPDDRRTYPWADLGGTPDEQLVAYYRTLARLRTTEPALTAGDLRFLVVGSDEEGTIAYGRRTDQQAAIVAVNRSGETREMVIPTTGYVPDGTSFRIAWGSDPVVSEFGYDLPVTADSGVLTISLPPLHGLVLVSLGGDVAAPLAPTQLTMSPTGDLSWAKSQDSVGYYIYSSVVSGGGYVRFTDNPIPVTSLSTIEAYGRYFVVTAVDAAGNESGWSNEVARF